MSGAEGAGVALWTVVAGIADCPGFCVNNDPTPPAPAVEAVPGVEFSLKQQPKQQQHTVIKQHNNTTATMTTIPITNLPK